MKRADGSECVLIALFILFFSTHADATDQVVTSNADSGAGSLRQAIADVLDGENITFNLGAGNEVITITSKLGAGWTKGMSINGDNVDGSGTNITVKVFTPGVSIYPVFNLRREEPPFEKHDLAWRQYIRRIGRAIHMEKASY